MFELKPCPFCDGEAEYIRKTVKLNGYKGDVVRVRCSKCHAQSPYGRNRRLHGFHVSDYYAADAWNRRSDYA